MSEQRGGYYRSGLAYVQPGLSRDVLVNALAITQTDEDQAHARYLLAVSLINDSKPDSIERGLELLDQVSRQRTPP